MGWPLRLCWPLAEMPTMRMRTPYRPPTDACYHGDIGPLPPASCTAQRVHKTSNVVPGGRARMRKRNLGPFLVDKDQRGITGLGTAIVLLVVVVVASVTPFALQNTGLLGSEKSKETVPSGLTDSAPTPNIEATVTAAVQTALASQATPAQDASSIPTPVLPTPSIEATISVAVEMALAAQPTPPQSHYNCYHRTYSDRSHTFSNTTANSLPHLHSLPYLHALSYAHPRTNPRTESGADTHTGTYSYYTCDPVLTRQQDRLLFHARRESGNLRDELRWLSPNPTDTQPIRQLGPRLVPRWSPYRFQVHPRRERGNLRDER